MTEHLCDLGNLNPNRYQCFMTREFVKRFIFFHGNVLDLILTNFTEHFQIQTDYDEELRTDHSILHFNLPVPSKPKRLCTTGCIYNYKNVNWSDMEIKINTSNLEDRVIDTTNIDEALSIWMNT